MATHAQASQAFEQLRDSVATENPQVAELMELLWQEAITALNSKNGLTYNWLTRELGNAKINYFCSTNLMLAFCKPGRLTCAKVLLTAYF